MRRRQIIEYLKLDNIDKYREFDIDIAIRGEKIYQNNKIKNLTSENNKYKAIVQGTEDYNVEVEFDENDKIKNMKCTCPYYKKGNNCKHISSVVFATKLRPYYEKINNYIDKELEILKTNYKNSNVKNKMLENKIKIIENNLIEKQGLYQRLNIAIDINIVEEDLEREIYYTKKAAEDVKRRYEEKIQEKEIRQRQTIKRKKHKPGLLFGLLSGLFSVSNDVYKETHDSKEYTEEELNDWNLTEEQKELVREGHYEPWNFEEDKKSLEEEDYFYEDDE